MRGWGKGVGKKNRCFSPLQDSLYKSMKIWCKIQVVIYLLKQHIIISTLTLTKHSSTKHDIQHSLILGSNCCA